MFYSAIRSRSAHYIARLGLCAFLIKAAMFLKSSYIIGSSTLFFSGSSIATPLLGAFNNPATCGLLLFIKFIFFGSFSLHTLAFIIPGYCAALYWSINHWSLRLLLPIACFLAFVTHPVGSQAALYAFYWLIPVGLYFAPHKNLFLTALASTFVAHAVGSTIWIYTVPMTAEMWTGLIPLVAIERFCFATGMVVVHNAIIAASSIFERVNLKNSVQRLNPIKHS